MGKVLQGRWLSEKEIAQKNRIINKWKCATYNNKKKFRLLKEEHRNLIQEKKKCEAKIEELKQEIIFLRNQNISILSAKTIDPFQPIKTVPKIAEYCGWRPETLYKYADELKKIGAIGYEYNGRSMNKQMVGLPYLIMKYFQKRNLKSKGYKKYETSRIV